MCIRDTPEKTKRLQTFVDVCVFSLCKIFKLLMSGVRRNNEVYKLRIALSRARSKVRNVWTHLSRRGLSAFIDPPPRENGILHVY